MSKSAKQWDINTSDIVSATVKSIIDGKFVLSDQYGRVTHAERAVSCLLEPEVGDRVLAVHTENLRYILAVLARSEDNTRTTTVSLDGDVTMSVPNGRLDITSGEGIHLHTPEDLVMSASRMGLSGEDLAAAFQRFELLGDRVEAHLSNVKLFSKQIKSRVESALQHFVTRHVNVDSIDSISAGSIKQTAKDLLSLTSAFSFIKAKKNVKIDGKQIFMG